jgi:hypothetical protein
MLGQERLGSRFAASKGKKTNDTKLEINLCADESMGPKRIDQEATTKHRDQPMIVSSPDEDDRSSRV